MKVKMFNENRVDKQKLIDYGFKMESNKFVLIKKTIDDLYFEVAINIENKEAVIEVKDEDNQTYDLFNVFSKNAYATKLQGLGNVLIEDIKKNCFFNLNIKLKVEDYIKNNYNIDTDFPFEGDAQTKVYRCPSKKWFVLSMRVRYKALGIESNEYVDIINVKASQEDVESLVDNEVFFKAYHMNKKKWMTIALVSNSQIDKIYELINKSYTLVEKLKK